MNSEKNWIYNQSGVTPFRFVDGKLQVLLITSHNGNWIFPKGFVEPDLSPQESARQEAIEEAGVEGFVFEKKIGEFRYRKWGGTCTVLMYLMRVDKINSDWPEKYFRTRKWVDLDAAKILADKRIPRRLLKKLPEIIEQIAK